MEQIKARIQRWGVVEVLRHHYVGCIAEWLVWSRIESDCARKWIALNPDYAYDDARKSAHYARIAIARTESMIELNHPRREA